MMKLLLRLVVVLIALFGTGCEEDYTPPPQKQQSKVTKDSEKLFAIDEKTYDDGYTYESSGKRDPFLPLIQETKTQTRKAVGDKGNQEVYVPTDPLENFDISQIVLLGIVMAGNNSRALLLAPDGKDYTIKLGAKIGRNRGVVTGFSARGVQVREKFVDFSGVQQDNTVYIELPQREGAE